MSKHLGDAWFKIVVNVWDDLIFLGDFVFTKDIGRIKSLRASIRCKNFHFIYGNHDKLIRKNQSQLENYFDFWGDYAEESFLISSGEKKSIVLCHYAFRVGTSVITKVGICMDIATDLFQIIQTCLVLMLV